MNQSIIRVGQHWQDLDERNTSYDPHTKRGKHRVVEIVSLPTLSQKGVMRVKQAPMNPGSVGQLREFSRGKLLNHYALIKEG